MTTKCTGKGDCDCPNCQKEEREKDEEKQESFPELKKELQRRLDERDPDLN